VKTPKNVIHRTKFVNYWGTRPSKVSMFFRDSNESETRKRYQ